MTVAVAGRKIDNILVLGFGLTGRAVVEFCLERQIAVSLSETRGLADVERSWLAERRVPFEEGGHTERLLAGADAVVLSPSVPADHPIVSASRAAGLLDLSELDLAFTQVGEIPVIAVTGTNGKGTTVSLIDSILRRVGRAPCLGGNIGTPFVSLLGDLASCDVIVLEVSSFQAEQSRLLRPHVAVLLNLTPDHLDRHGSMNAYAEAKGRLFRLQARDDVAILPRELNEAFSQGAGRRVFFDAPPPALPPGAERLSPHNRANLAAAGTAASALDPNLSVRSLSLGALSRAFTLPHRLQDVGVIGGVRIVNDSKSTNADSAVAALRAVDAPTVLLAGGRSKSAGYAALAREIETRTVRSVIVFGEAAAEFATLFESKGIEAVRAGDLEEAVDLGLAEARSGDVLLFSPACSSFDAFRNYAERGEAFLRVIRERSGFTPTAAQDTRS